MDQIAAKQLGKDTQLASLELGSTRTSLVGACDAGYSCAYTNTLAWRTPTTPLPMENNPRAVFERLFGDSDSTTRRRGARDGADDRSILDSVSTKHLRQRARPGRSRAESRIPRRVRDVERRIQKAEEQIDLELPSVEQPAGVPSDVRRAREADVRPAGAGLLSPT